MSTVHRTLQAERDVEEIIEYLDGRSPRAAERFAAEYDRVCNLLAGQPGLGRARDELRLGARSAVLLQNYVIVFTPIPGGVSIIRVLHGSRDLKTAFDEADSD
jgi:toxin ParE1/3/4